MRLDTHTKGSYMTEEYKKRLIELAKEIHDLQLKESEGLKDMKNVAVNFDVIRLTSKINFLIGYIMALEETDE